MSSTTDQGVVDDSGTSDAGVPPDAAHVDTGSTDADIPPELISEEEAMDHIDPFIGSGGLGFNHGAMTPAAQRPHGFVRLGPDTTRAGVHPDFHHFSGYHFDDPDTRGFSHTRFVGTGIADFGNLRVLPTRSPEQVDFTAMDKSTEQASPGRYQVYLPEMQVLAELTTTPFGGLHRYTFEEDGWLQFDAASSVSEGGVRAVEIEVEGDRLTGAVTYAGPMTGRGHAEGFTLFFYGRLDPAPTEVVELSEGRVALSVEAGVTTLDLAVSLINADQARANFDAELADTDFDTAAEASRADWAALIGKVRVSRGTEADLERFYTALYHTHAMPTRYDEMGRYRGIDNQVHTLDREGGYYSDLSLWDTFRTLHPWYTLAHPELQRDCLNSLLDMAVQGGSMPRWPAINTYGSSMISSSADHLFAEGALKGIEGVDYASAFDILWAGANGPTQYAGRRSIEDYLNLGYVSVESTGGSVSRTVEYAWADASLARLAERLGHTEEAMTLTERSFAWRALLDPSTGFLTPKTVGGEFMEIRPTSIHMEGDAPYVEGSAWHWRFYAFQHPEALAEALAEATGNPEALAEALDVFFQRSGFGEGRWVPTRPDPYYWQGNEPDLHSPWLYYAAGRPESAQRWIRAIQQKAYGLGADGLVGNDDGGTLSAWLLFSAVGLYPVAGSDQYLLSPPLFERIHIDRGDQVIKIRAPGASLDAWRINEARLNDQPITDGLTHDVLLDGTLWLQMAAP
ncbi:MAG: GH92 family glycosyl hydrolase [Bradymonadia bacterium]